MRHMVQSLPRLALGAAAVALLATTLILRQGAAAAFDRREAFAAQIQSGERTLSVPSIAAEWRQEIAAQRVIARRDLLLSRVLLGAGIFVVIAFAVSLRPPEELPSIASGASQ